MKRRSVFVAAFLAAALLGSMSVYADWYRDGNNWRYYDDARSQDVVGTWKQINGIWYYFDDYGIMASGRAIYDGSRYYYLDPSGAMVTNTWIKTTLPDRDTAGWTYFDESGRAPASGWREIGGKTYHFTDGWMDYGFLDGDGNPIDAGDQEAFKQAVYYCGTADEGWRWQDQWLGVNNNDSDEYRYTGNTLWLYFGGNGRKVADRRDEIRYANGTTYKCTFDHNGVMTSEQPMSGSGSGATAQARWVEQVPTASQNNEDYENGTRRWFYQNASGSYAADQIKKIDANYYAFDAGGIMRTGLLLFNDGHYGRTLANPDQDLYPSMEQVQAEYGNGDIYYFAPGGERKSGKVQVELNDGAYTMGFASDGKALNGVSSNYLYDRGFLVTAGDYRYRLVEVGGKQYLVNAAGSIMKKGTYTDADGFKYKVEKDGENYVITKVN